jgi:hypothetical protein
MAALEFISPPFFSTADVRPDGWLGVSLHYEMDEDIL